MNSKTRRNKYEDFVSSLCLNGRERIFAIRRNRETTTTAMGYELSEAKERTDCRSDQRVLILDAREVTYWSAAVSYLF